MRSFGSIIYFVVVIFAMRISLAAKWGLRYDKLHDALTMCRKLTPMLAELLPEPAFEEVREAAESLEGLVDLVVAEVADVVTGAEDRAAGK